jgi:hypothetical protein
MDSHPHPRITGTETRTTADSVPSSREGPAARRISPKVDTLARFPARSGVRADARVTQSGDGDFEGVIEIDRTGGRTRADPSTDVDVRPHERVSAYTSPSTATRSPHRNVGRDHRQSGCVRTSSSERCDGWSNRLQLTGQVILIAKSFDRWSATLRRGCDGLGRRCPGTATPARLFASGARLFAIHEDLAPTLPEGTRGDIMRVLHALEKFA